jgi:hypothetical protein
MSERWEDTDKPIYFFHNFSDVRAAINVKYSSGGESWETSKMTIFQNNTIPADPS